MAKTAAAAAKAKPAILHLEALVALSCCGKASSDETIEANVAASSPGKELAKFTCDLCGSEYLLGVIAKTREESLASEAFEHLTDEEEEKIGIDRSDVEPSAEDVAMCALCDGDVNRRRDYCQGCKDYVCQSCRVRQPSKARHMAEEHREPSQAEKLAARKAQSGAAGAEPERALGDELVADE